MQKLVILKERDRASVFGSKIKRVVKRVVPSVSLQVFQMNIFWRILKEIVKKMKQNVPLQVVINRQKQLFENVTSQMRIQNLCKHQT